MIFDLKHFTIFPTKSQYVFATPIDKNKSEGIKMTVGEKMTANEKLIEFILNLTDEECEIILSRLNNKEKEQP